MVEALTEEQFAQVAEKEGSSPKEIKTRFESGGEEANRIRKEAGAGTSPQNKSSPWLGIIISLVFLGTVVYLFYNGTISNFLS